MNTLFIVYHDLNTEARSQEMLQLLKLYGSTTVVSYCDFNHDVEVKVYSNRNNKKGIISFLLNGLVAILKRPSLIMLHDEYPMILVPVIKLISPKSIIIHDSSELRLPFENDQKSTIKMRIARLFRYVEKKYIKQCDIVISANQERASIMKDYYKLETMPLVFDNVHRIDCSYNLEYCDFKYGSLLDSNCFKALYAGGLADKRLSYTIAEQIGKLGAGYQLIICGLAENNGEKKLESIISGLNGCNISYIGFVSREELKYLLERVDVSISAFAMDTLNNINCASGKVYESLFVGTPLLTGINPPLVHLCDEYGVGVSTSDFGKGLIELQNNYLYYKTNVSNYVSIINKDDRIIKLKKMIDDSLSLE